MQTIINLQQTSALLFFVLLIFGLRRNPWTDSGQEQSIVKVLDFGAWVCVGVFIGTTFFRIWG